MKVLITGRHIHIGHHLEEFVTAKCQKLGRHMPLLAEVRVELTADESRTDEERYRCQVMTTVDHRTFYATEGATELHAAVNGAVAKLDRQLSKLKVTHQHKGRPALSQVQALLNEA